MKITAQINSTTYVEVDDHIVIIERRPSPQQPSADRDRVILNKTEAALLVQFIDKYLQ